MFSLLTIGPYEDTVMCTVVPMDICHLLLGRPWQFDHRSIHDGAKNTHSFLYNGRKLILEPLKPPDMETTMCTTFLADARESVSLADSLRAPFVTIMVSTTSGTACSTAISLADSWGAPSIISTPFASKTVPV
ncbi:hypothetical protein IFM89_034521 [Coptis chinensis]|uniref:Uncharacterized protein n=1 Tax=Coptis chinensis TaxID=261450 RepID=A0A835LPF1_9MAGN|nr:hypothetical protein IFM89_034521 [Coptis chinensis]